MATDVNDLGDMIGSTLGRLAREATHTMSPDGRGSNTGLRGVDGALSGTRGVVAGLALAAAAPLAARGAGKVAQKAAQGLKGSVTDAVGKKVEQVGGAPGAATEAAKQMLPGIGGGGEDMAKGKKGTPGVGKGRRMPIQQAVDIAVPAEVAYNQWTQFEEWPQFMHRLDQITQEDDCTVSFKTKVWGMSKEFVAQIVEQRPDERIQWTIAQGVTHTGVVTFHELAPRLTRVQVSLDVEPGSLVEKAARGLRHVKRAVRADLARFKAYIEMQEVETGAWRGTIHDGEVVKKHPRNYDRGREAAKSSSSSRSSSSRAKSGQHSGRSRSPSSGGSKKSSSGRKRGGSRSS
jgi:uncharacterized membrane protein